MKKTNPENLRKLSFESKLEKICGLLRVKPEYHAEVELTQLFLDIIEESRPSKDLIQMGNTKHYREPTIEDYYQNLIKKVKE